MQFLEKRFHLTENHTTVKTEVLAGLTTFMTMAYILIVNPTVLNQAGMDKGAVLTATALASSIATFCMAFFTNYPFALSAGMGLNAYFAYTIVLQKGNSWQMALTAVFIEGILFIILSAVKVREKLFDSIPMNVKRAVSVGIGLYIAFIGLQNAGIVVKNESTMLALGDVTSIPVALSLLGTVLTVVLLYKKVRGALLWGILITYAIGVVCQFCGIYQVDVQAGRASLLPTGLISMPPSLKPVFLKFDFSNILSLDFFIVIISFLFVDLFDTLGTLMGVSTKANFLDDKGRLPKIRGALYADAIGTTVGACLGTSTVSTYIESAAGVADGGRTGLCAVVTGFLFLAALLFTPLLTVIPSFATTPALIVVGLFMIEQVGKISFHDYTEGFPAFMTILMMVCAYSISEGLIFGVVSYVLLKFLSGRSKELNGVIVLIAILFIIRLIFS